MKLAEILYHSTSETCDLRLYVGGKLSLYPTNVVPETIFKDFLIRNTVKDVKEDEMLDKWLSSEATLEDLNVDEELIGKPFSIECASCIAKGLNYETLLTRTKATLLEARKQLLSIEEFKATSSEEKHRFLFLLMPFFDPFTKDIARFLNEASKSLKVCFMKGSREIMFANNFDDLVGKKFPKPKEVLLVLTAILIDENLRTNKMMKNLAFVTTAKLCKTCFFEKYHAIANSVAAECNFNAYKSFNKKANLDLNSSFLNSHPFEVRHVSRSACSVCGSLNLGASLFKIASECTYVDKKFVIFKGQTTLGKELKHSSERYLDPCSLMLEHVNPGRYVAKFHQNGSIPLLNELLTVGVNFCVLSSQHGVPELYTSALKVSSAYVEKYDIFVGKHLQKNQSLVFVLAKGKTCSLGTIIGKVAINVHTKADLYDVYSLFKKVGSISEMCSDKTFAVHMFCDFSKLITASVSHDKHAITLNILCQSFQCSNAMLLRGLAKAALGKNSSLTKQTFLNFTKTKHIGTNKEQALEEDRKNFGVLVEEMPQSMQKQVQNIKEKPLKNYKPKIRTQIIKQKPITKENFVVDDVVLEEETKKTMFYAPKFENFYRLDQEETLQKIQPYATKPLKLSSLTTSFAEMFEWLSFTDLLHNTCITENIDSETYRDIIEGSISNKGFGFKIAALLKNINSYFEELKLQQKNERMKIVQEKAKQVASKKRKSFEDAMFLKMKEKQAEEETKKEKESYHNIQKRTNQRNKGLKIVIFLMFITSLIFLVVRHFVF